MSFYLSVIAQSFMPVFLVVACLAASLQLRLTKKTTVIGLSAIAVIIVAAGILYRTCTIASDLIELKMLVQVLALGGAILCFLVLFWSWRFSATKRQPSSYTIAITILVAIGPMFLQGALMYFDVTSVHTMSATAVLNSELIINGSSIILGVIACLLTFFFCFVFCKKQPNFIFPFASILLVIMSLFWLAQLGLSALQTGSIEITAERVSFIAKLSDLEAYRLYILIAVLLVFAVCSYRYSVWQQKRIPAGVTRAQKRKDRAVYLQSRRQFNQLLLTGVFWGATASYYDFYASLPPQRSEALPVTPDANGNVILPIEKVKDGRLHRFSYISSDGHRVRFFLINRFDEQNVKIAVVFDACMICGDEGYIQEGNEVYCIACGVRVFVPSIGKEGGCNPIPLKHREENGQIVINRRALEKGATYFSEQIEITVEDPVSKAELSNMSAPYSYEHDGFSYFFASEHNYDLFRENPERYLPVSGAKHPKQLSTRG
ncbi:Fe-S-containing protein [Polycladidibacter stylochi]|uniref:Fe-S-containing protein n=1 Tax=Polycladidibacter stylochi TaxID=1807766 RepID=UPI000829D443|nr:Fe-S-containing protein [Pseudovibrio stylochi]